MVGHIKVLAVFHILWSLMWLFAALLSGLVAVFVIGLLALSDDASAAASVFVLVVLLAISAAFALLAVPGLVGGIALLLRRGWARVPLFIAAVLALSSFPYGLALFGYTLVVLLDDDVRRELAAW